MANSQTSCSWTPIIRTRQRMRERPTIIIIAGMCRSPKDFLAQVYNALKDEPPMGPYGVCAQLR